MSTHIELFTGLPDDEQALAMALLFERKFGQQQTSTITYVDLQQFLNEPPRERHFLVDGILARGHLAMLGGRPKSGKSWLALQLAMAVDMGKPFLGRSTNQGRVLYAPLEDGPERLYERSHTLGWAVRQSKAVFKLSPLHMPNGSLGPGIDQLAEAAGDFDLIIVDTLSTLLSGRVNENDNAAMGSIVNEVAQIAHSSNCAILLIHHAGKAFNEDDHFTLMRGASAIRAAYDVGMLLVRKPGEHEAVLRMESRDTDVEGMTIRQSASNASWEWVGDLSVLTHIRAGRRVVEALLEIGDWQTVEDIADYLKISKQAVHAQLQRAEKEMLVKRQILPSDKRGRPTTIWAIYDSMEDPYVNDQPALIPTPHPQNALTI
jgi:KaiC/GvpD/RAD55 family RecA-like ATPase